MMQPDIKNLLQKDISIKLVSILFVTSLKADGVMNAAGMRQKVQS